MTQTSLPAARAAFIDQTGRPTPQFYRFLETLATAQAANPDSADIAAINAELAALQAEIDALPKGGSYPVLQVLGPLVSNGLLQNGFAQLRWNGTTSDVPEGSRLYFTDVRAQEAVVDNAITPGVTTKAPSEDAVSRALASTPVGAPYYVPPGSIFTVPLNQQVPFVDPIVLDGDMVINGRLIDISIAAN